MAVPLDQCAAQRQIESALRNAQIPPDAVQVNFLVGGVDDGILDTVSVHLNDDHFSGTWDEIITCIESSTLDTLGDNLRRDGFFRPDNPDCYIGR